MIDSTIVWVHQTSSGKISNSADGSIGRSSRGLPTKIHVRVDGKGRPLQFNFSPGNSPYISEAFALLNFQAKPKFLLADRGYDANFFREKLILDQITPVIPGGLNLLQPIILYKQRNLVEGFFARLKNFRRIATRSDRNLETFQTFVTAVAILLHFRI